MLQLFNAGERAELFTEIFRWGGGVVKLPQIFQTGWGEAFFLHFWPLFHKICDGYKYLIGGQNGLF